MRQLPQWVRPWLRVSAADQHQLAAARFSAEPRRSESSSQPFPPWVSGRHLHSNEIHHGHASCQPESVTQIRLHMFRQTFACHGPRVRSASTCTYGQGRVFQKKFRKRVLDLTVPVWGREGGRQWRAILGPDIHSSSVGEQRDGAFTASRVKIRLLFSEFTMHSQT